MNTTAKLAFALIILSCLPPALLAQSSEGITSGMVHQELFLGGGGDGDSPWPVFLRLRPQLGELDKALATGGRLGEATLFAWTAFDGRRHRIRLARLSMESGTELFELGDGRSDDLAPELVGSSRGVAVIWRRHRRGRLELVAQALDRTGRPTAGISHLAFFEEGVLAMAAAPAGSGEYLLGRMRRLGRSHVIELARPGAAFLPLGTVPIEACVRLSFACETHEEACLVWSELENCTTQARAREQIHPAAQRETKRALLEGFHRRDDK